MIWRELRVLELFSLKAHWSTCASPRVRAEPFIGLWISRLLFCHHALEELCSNWIQQTTCKYKNSHPRLWRAFARLYGNWRGTYLRPSSHLRGGLEPAPRLNRRNYDFASSLNSVQFGSCTQKTQFLYGSAFRKRILRKCQVRRCHVSIIWTPKIRIFRTTRLWPLRLLDSVIFLAPQCHFCVRTLLKCMLPNLLLFQIMIPLATNMTSIGEWTIITYVFNPLLHGGGEKYVIGLPIQIYWNS